MDPKVIETIVALAKEFTALRENGDYPFAFSEHLANYKVPKVKWLPKEDDNYWVWDGDGSTREYIWSNDPVDKDYLLMGNTYPTEEAAEAAAAKIRQFVKGLNESV